MIHDVFISYSSKDKLAADAACAVLEQNGIKCWIAPRDIRPGQAWANAIVYAIGASRMIVLIFSGNCNVSPQIEREIELAIDKSIPIIPMRIEDVLPSNSMEYYLSTPHWFDAFPPPLDRYFSRLLDVVVSGLKSLSTSATTDDVQSAPVSISKQSGHAPITGDAAATTSRNPEALVPVPSEQAPANYIDRPELTVDLLAFLLGEDSGRPGRAVISAVHGLGGIGKTTIARWLVWQPEIEAKFIDGRLWITLGNEPLDALTILNDVASQFDPTLRPKATLEAARADLAALLRTKSALVVIDDVWPGRSLETAKALLVPSSRSRFLLTTRFAELTSDWDVQAAEFPLDEMNPLQAVALIGRVLGRKLDASEQDRAQKLSAEVGGHPLALELAAARIREGVPWETLLADLTAQIVRLESLDRARNDLVADVVSAEGRRKRTSVQASLLLSVHYLSPQGQRLFAWFGVIAEDATIAPAMAATLWDLPIEKAAHYLRTLSGSGLLRSVENGFQIHDLMHALARNLLTAPGIPAHTGDLPGLGLDLPAATGQFLERYRAKLLNGAWHTVPEDGYIHEHLLQHLEIAGLVGGFEGLLSEETAAGLNGWYDARSRLGQTAGFLADVRRVWDHADRQFEQAVATGAAIALQMHCALITVSINSLSAAITPEVLAGAVRCEVMSPAAARALAEQNPDMVARVRALVAVGEAAPPPWRASILADALGMACHLGFLLDDDELDRIRRLVRAANEARDEVLERAQQVEKISRLPLNGILAAVQIGDLYERADFLSEVTQRLSEVDAFAVARQISNEIVQAIVLIVIMGRMPLEDQHDICKEALSYWHDPETLIKIAERLPTDVDRRVRDLMIDAARQRWDASAIAELVRHFDGDERPVVLDEAFKVQRRQTRPSVSGLAEIIRRLPGEMQLDQLKPILEAADDIAEANDRAERLMDAAYLLAGAARQQLAEHALGIALDIGDGVENTDALLKTAERLPSGLDAPILSAALHYASSIPSVLKYTRRQRSEALAAVARRLDPTAAWHVINGIQSVDVRAEALANLASRLPAEQAIPIARRAALSGYADPLLHVSRRLPTEEAILIVRECRDPEVRARATVELAARIEAPGRSRLAEEAIGFARGVSDPIRRIEMLLVLAEHMPEVRSAALSAIISSAAKVAKGRRSELLEEVARRLPRDHAATVARSVADPRSRARLLRNAAMMPCVDDETDLLAEALQAAREMEDASRRAIALAAIWGLLPAPARGPLLDEIHSSVRGVADPWQRANTIADVLRELPVGARARLSPDLLDAVNSLDADQHHGTAVTDIALRLPPEQAFDLVRSIEMTASARNSFLWQAATRFPPEFGASFAEEISDLMGKESAQSRVAHRLPPVPALAVGRAMMAGKARDQVLANLSDRFGAEDAITIIDEIADPQLKGEALLRLAIRLPPDQARAALQEITSARLPPGRTSSAFSAARQDRELRSQILAKLIPRLDTPLEAFESSAKIEDPFWRSESLVATMLTMNEHDLHPRLRQNWSEVLRIFSTKTRANFISGLVELLPLIVTSDDQRSTLLTAAADSVARIGRWWP